MAREEHQDKAEHSAEDTPLQGGELIKERYISEDEFLVYSLFYMHSMDWPEGLEVINSFTVTD